MRAVYDTNVFVSAFIFPGSHADRAYRLAIRGKVELYSSPAIITETAAVLRTKSGWDQEHTVAAVKSIGRVARVIKPEKRLAVLADEPDNRILECAVASGADVIVTGDRHLQRLKSCEGVAVLRLGDFLASFPVA